MSTDMFARGKAGLFFLLVGGALAVGVFSGADARGEDRVRFNRDVRPILSDVCFHCHGFDEKERKAGLRLDIREEAMKAAESGAVAIVPGHPERSELIARITTHDRSDLMPPPKLNKPLTQAQKDLLVRWIKEGAEYEGHWAFIPPERKESPVKTPHPIDGFIQVGLTEKGLSPSPEAPRETLIRRVTYDLTGLPPSPHEVQHFMNDKEPGAYERVVDRLLRSPRYGEHMAAQWLDKARYADSNGFQSDTHRNMWPWRDWVIKTFNDNMPFDQFTIEQLAGDLLPNATRDQILATGFNRNHRLNGEGGRIVEEWFVETVIDRVETTGSTWLALTFNCCRCHDHKYDPISQREFFQFFAYFNSNEELGVMDEFGGGGRSRAGGNSKPVLMVPTTPEESTKLAELEAAIVHAEKNVAAARSGALARLPAWEAEMRASLGDGKPTWNIVDPTSVVSEGGATLTRQADGSWLASGTNPATEVYTITAPVASGRFSGLLLEVIPDASLPNKNVGRASNGNFVLGDVDVAITAPSLAAPLTADFVRAEADYSQKNWEIGLVIAGKATRKGRNSKGWAVDGPSRIAPSTALFALAAPLDIPDNATLTITLRHEALDHHHIGRFRLSYTDAMPETVALKSSDGVPPPVRAALLTPIVSRNATQKKAVEEYFMKQGDAVLAPVLASVDAAKKALADYENSLANVMVMREKPQPKPAFILDRGEYDRPTEKVERATPAALPPMAADYPNNRLGLARWMVDGKHPLTARVWVNRAWERFFGTGLVKTTEDFGSQAEWPSHPELLDWLATEFVRLGWDMKAMQRLIVTSHAYRQSARILPEHMERDPENRLLARSSRIRLPAEVLRDQSLAAGGLLVEKIGGPSVRPYMPEAVWDETSVYGDMRNYKADTGEGLYRRSLYTIWKRTAAPPSMLLFDSPSREICTVKRTRSNTPMQALSLLNEVTHVEAARHLAQGMMTHGGSTPDERIAWAFQRVTARAPRPEELHVLVQGLHRRLAQFGADREGATALVNFGAAKPPPPLDVSELAAFTVTANILLNLDETTTRP